MAKILWKETGWNSLQEADAEKHILAIDCRTEKGKVVEVRIRHNDGEEQMAKVTLGGENALPMEIREFQSHYDRKELDFQ